MWSFVKDLRQKIALMDGGRSDGERHSSCRGARDSYARLNSRSNAATREQKRREDPDDDARDQRLTLIDILSSQRHEGQK